MQENNYPDADKKIIFPLDWLKYFSRKREKLGSSDASDREE